MRPRKMAPPLIERAAPLRSICARTFPISVIGLIERRAFDEIVIAIAEILVGEPVVDEQVRLALWFGRRLHRHGSDGNADANVSVADSVRLEEIPEIPRDAFGVCAPHMDQVRLATEWRDVARFGGVGSVRVDEAAGAGLDVVVGEMQDFLFFPMHASADDQHFSERILRGMSAIVSSRNPRSGQAVRFIRLSPEAAIEIIGICIKMHEGVIPIRHDSSSIRSFKDSRCQSGDRRIFIQFAVGDLGAGIDGEPRMDHAVRFDPEESVLAASAARAAGGEEVYECDALKSGRIDERYDAAAAAGICVGCELPKAFKCR